MAKARSVDEELTFLEHLDELRGRIMRMFLYWFGATSAAWFFRTPLLAVLRRPAELGAEAIGAEKLDFRIFDPAGGFMLAMIISMVTGLVVVSPLILWELWGFIKPALHKREQRWVIVMIPSASALFLGGVAFSYWISPMFFAYLFRINQSMGVESELTLTSYLTFMLKLLLASGASFELPLVIMFLSYVGLVKSDWLLAKWRQAVVVVAILAAVITPSNDPLTMSIFSLPLFFLYFLSVWLVRITEKGRARRLAKEAAVEEAQAKVVETGDPMAYYQSLTADTATEDDAPGEDDPTE
jgi:sec-independent protein translocase protein TatC